MPKMKTRRSAAKRFKFTSTGKIKHKRTKMRHLLAWKSSKQTRGLSREVIVSPTDKRRVKEMLPYGAS